MKCIRRITLFSLSVFSSATMAHGGHFHLDEKTLEKIFQSMDQTYQWFIGHLPLMGAIVVGLLVLLAIGKAIRTQTG